MRGNRGGWRRDIGLDLCQKNASHVSQIFVSTGLEVKIGGFQAAARWERRLWVERRNRGRVLGGLGHEGRRGSGVVSWVQNVFWAKFQKKSNPNSVFHLLGFKKDAFLRGNPNRQLNFHKQQWGSKMKPDELVHNQKKKIKKPECQSIECQTDWLQEIISLWLERNREKIE